MTHARSLRSPLASLATVLGVVACLLVARAGAAPQTRDVLIFAAASMQTAIDELTPRIQQTTGIRVKASYAASSALARQIESAAPADIFISADLDWMNYLAERQLIRPETRANLVGNDLVLVAPAGRVPALTIAPGFRLADALGDSRLALADPSSVPAGKYAKAALTTLGVWESVSAKVASAENVRAALLLVSTGEAPLGIVYRTDASAEPRVAVVDTFASSLHPPIVYPIALTTTASPNAARVLTFLQGAAAKAVFATLGFKTATP